MNKAQKTEQVKNLTESFTKAGAVFFTDYRGLGVNDVNDLRAELRKHDVYVKVVKNNLARIAVKEAKLGEESEKLLDTVAGPTMVVFANGDVAATAKALQTFSEKNEALDLKEGLMGAKRISTDEVKELAELPSRDVLIAKLLATMNAPVQNFVGVLAAVPRSLVQVLAAVGTKKEGQA